MKIAAFAVNKPRWQAESCLGTYFLVSEIRRKNLSPVFYPYTVPVLFVSKKPMTSDDQICQKHYDGIVVKPQVYLKVGHPESQLFPI